MSAIAVRQRDHCPDNISLQKELCFSLCYNDKYPFPAVRHRALVSPAKSITIFAKKIQFAWKLLKKNLLKLNFWLVETTHMMVPKAHAASPHYDALRFDAMITCLLRVVFARHILRVSPPIPRRHLGRGGWRLSDHSDRHIAIVRVSFLWNSISFSETKRSHKTA